MKRSPAHALIFPPAFTSGMLRASSARNLCMFCEQCLEMDLPPWPSKTAYMWYAVRRARRRAHAARSPSSSGWPFPRVNAGGSRMVAAVRPRVAGPTTCARGARRGSRQALALTFSTPSSSSSSSSTGATARDRNLDSQEKESAPPPPPPPGKHHTPPPPPPPARRAAPASARGPRRRRRPAARAPPPAAATRARRRRAGAPKAAAARPPAASDEGARAEGARATHCFRHVSARARARARAHGLEGREASSAAQKIQGKSRKKRKGKCGVLQQVCAWEERAPPPPFFLPAAAPRARPCERGRGARGRRARAGGGAGGPRPAARAARCGQRGAASLRAAGSARQRGDAPSCRPRDVCDTQKMPGTSATASSLAARRPGRTQRLRGAAGFVMRGGADCRRVMKRTRAARSGATLRLSGSCCHCGCCGRCRAAVGDHAPRRTALRRRRRPAAHPLPPRPAHHARRRVRRAHRRGTARRRAAAAPPAALAILAALAAPAARPHSGPHVVERLHRSIESEGRRQSPRARRPARALPRPPLRGRKPAPHDAHAAQKTEKQKPQPPAIICRSALTQHQDGTFRGSSSAPSRSSACLLGVSILPGGARPPREEARALRCGAHAF